MNAVVPIDTNYDIMEKVIAMGDLSKLSSKERVEYYSQICKSLGLNPLTRPFEFIKFDGKLVLYARKDASEQLRSKAKISIYRVEKETIEGVFIYTAYARSKEGQEDVGSGAVTIKGLTGKALANAFKIAETQAKRRVTLSICGLSFTDESELPDVPNVQVVKIDPHSGDMEEDKPKVITPHRQDLIQAILNAKTMDDLKNAYRDAYQAHLGDTEMLKDICILKDRMKHDIEQAALEKIENQDQTPESKL